MIEKEIFQRYIIFRDKLLQYGFYIENHKFVFQQKILNDSFDVVVTYDINGINGKIIDLSDGDEYITFRTNIEGEFHQKVRREFETILFDIRDKCCQKQNYIYEQSNRVDQYIKNKLKSNPEFLWDSYPNYAVYRNEKNKWFSIIMDITLDKLGYKQKNRTVVEVINVKIDPNCKQELLKMDGIYEGYHMNKKHWVSIILNDTISDEKIFELVCGSYHMT